MAKPWRFLGFVAMVCNRPLWWWSVALAGGALAGAALPPLGCPPLLWLALVPLWGLGPAAACLWAALAVLVSHRWLLWLHPLDWVGVPLPLSLPLCVLLWAGCGLLGAALVGGWRWLVQRLGPERWGTALLAAALWGLVEVALARGPLFWIGLGAAALPGDRALAAWAGWVGAGGLAALQLLFGWGLWRLWALARGRRRLLWRSGLLWLAVVLAVQGLGWWRLGQAQRPGAAVDDLALLVLQPAIPTRRKFDWDQQQALLSRLEGALGQAQQLPVQAVVLPEGALPLGQVLPQPAAVQVLSGGFRLVGERLRSALLVFNPGAQAASAALDKHRLVPLGEWIPGGELFAWAGLSAVGGVSPGAPSRLLPRPQGGIGVVICYELADGTAVAAATRDGAGWLLASANLDPYPLLLQRQFMALAQLRALEADRWLVSAANTGPSLVVDPAGVVRQQLPPFVPGRLVAQLQVRQGLTGYARWGELPLLLLLAAGAALLWRESRVRQS